MSTITGTERYVRNPRGTVVHRPDCAYRGNAAPWRYADGRTLSSVLAEIGQTPWLRACTRCMQPSGAPGLQLELGRALRDRGAAVADENAGQDWRSVADRAIDHLASTGRPFTADDVRALGVPDPSSPRAWGARFLAASKQGRIERVGYAPSRRASVHAHPIAVWKGLAA